MKIALQTIASTLIGLAVFGLFVFWPAGTFDYWQGWTFIAVFAAATTIPSLYLAATDPAALRRRMQAGPAAETGPLQQLIISFAFVSLGATIVVSALDFRFGWSTVPAAISVIGDVLVALGLGIAMLVVIQNSYASADVTVESGRTGLDGLVRLGPAPDVFRQCRVDGRDSALHSARIGTALLDSGTGRARRPDR